ncbi:anthranilate phosphoribosyltransferase [Acinetobacter baylyi]|uniref:Anthranilate phosphoribosyltransferase n=1 Tax=Acinetobacter baylyi (strain ATCC 33305 / BD413 / ADP1) TaxID=62977 RepID=TRPD_ACIAD|nr:anthranilate phosphoribosyltransferase [Acinetobacter baylyi]P00500.1 RecName: Full=Anthranilate phosphoribosyltransferase [Acinetobacter baylyi ADP1]AAA21904.1 anthranilate phosphoribosyltransferase (EC 2.4.2.18) [Acinetobacter calcoaceticus]ENV54169.1 anthranilate phosphoribosyltransferase [Acinetobacter baylyi DSM 14961 = CIP 107474]KAF2371824.1 anthranilate phosphoribosyltransferase [Acinetobacter baylyi]KAF2375322.1 anthranilate phosphoribosyltransferase [Acinetobacter baylyi]KAF23768
MNIQQALNHITKNIHLTQAQMEDVMRSIMQGEATEAQIGALMMGLRMKGESIDEITAAARVMRELAIKIDVSDIQYLVDIVGTGGDGQNLFNVSTASSFVIAAAGATIAKHGNRGVSSKSGSSDLLEQAGINLDLDMQQTERCIREMGVGFLFAPNHHKAMKYAVGPRRELGIRSIFNLLGPLTNPAGVKRFVIGVFSDELCRPIAEVMKQLGAEHVMVVHSKDGLDEISLASQTYIAELKNGEVTEWVLNPEDVNIPSQTLSGLIVEDSNASLKLIKDALGRKKSDIGEKAANMIALNAGAGIYVSGLATSYKQGVALAHDIIYGGQALEKMSILSEFTKALKEYANN